MLLLCANIIVNCQFGTQTKTSTGIFSSSPAVSLFNSLNAQDITHYKQIVKELSSSKYQGRGYAMNGANKAGEYLLYKPKFPDAFLTIQHDNESE